MEVRKVEWGKEHFSSFFEVPQTLGQRDNDLEKKQLSPTNLFFDHAEGCGFMAHEEGIFKGRVFASLDHNLHQKEGQIVGHIGYFCFSDKDTCLDLLEKAERWLKDKGATHVHGPMNLNIINGYRLQMSGFETTPFPGEPRNPSCYKDYLHEAGHREISTWSTWDVSSQFIKMKIDHSKKICRQHSIEGMKIRPANILKFEEELANIYECALEAFVDNYGMAKISEREFIQSLMHLKPLMADEFFYLIEEDNGNIGGFFMGYKDDPHHPSRLIFHTMALKKRWQKTIAPYLVALPLCQAAHQRNLPGIGALAKKGRTTFDGLKAPDRTYSMFSKKL
jgi:hypothetical protein